MQLVITLFIKENLCCMTIKRPTSNQRPRNQSSKTPSGKKIPMAMSMMVDSMVRMIQKASNNESNLDSDDITEERNGN